MGIHCCERTQILVKFRSHFPPFKHGKQQNFMSITTVTFTKIGQAILDNVPTLGKSKLSIRLLCLLWASHNCLFSYFGQISLTLNEFAGWRPETLLKGDSRYFPANFPKPVNCYVLHLKWIWNFVKFRENTCAGVSGAGWRTVTLLALLKRDSYTGILSKLSRKILLPVNQYASRNLSQINERMLKQFECTTLQDNVEYNW